jgi:hypothetical protein
VSLRAWSSIPFFWQLPSMLELQDSPERAIPAALWDRLPETHPKEP